MSIVIKKRTIGPITPWRPLVLALGLLVIAGCSDDAPEPDEPDEPQIAEGIFAALGEPMPLATAEQRESFDRGFEQITRVWAPEDGLGPQFNVTFCGACHESPVFGGGGPRYRDFYLSASVLGDGSFITPGNGGIVHAYGNGDAPVRPVVDDSYNILARRNAIPFFGVGLIAELPESVILANADPDDADGDGISGRPNYEDGFVGRFGRKAQTTSIEGFIRGPLNNHLGITSDPLTDAQRALLPVPSNADAAEATRGATNGLEAANVRHQGVRGAHQMQAAAASEPLFDTDGVADPELDNQALFDLVSYTMLLAPPEPSAPTAESTAGAEHFETFACASCHVPALEGPRGLVPLYSDLLLHDMGDAFADGLQQGLATGSEFRTQPLWGVVASAPYLHDGRADTLQEAILAHGGEAQASRDAYANATAQEKLELDAFLRSLGGETQASEGLLPPNAPAPAAQDWGAPLGEMTDAQRALWFEGRRLFDRNQPLSEGLGPFFNGDSCRACHFQPVLGGAGPLGVNVMRHGTVDEAGTFSAPPGGTIVAKFGIPGLARPEPTSVHNVLEPRQTPHSFGLGAIESIPEEVIRAGADPDDLDGDGIRGVVSITPGGAIGRFGWKAQVPSVRDFVRDAMGAELGVTVPEDDSTVFGATADNDDTPDPELPLESLDALEFFLVALAPPPRGASDADGEQAFADFGCASCHTPVLQGSEGPVALYSDLLLHDVAADEFVGVPDGTANGRQFRTPPLWGVSQTAPYMHDGSASTLRASIEAHAGEASASRQAWSAATDEERAALLRMLGGL